MGCWRPTDWNGDDGNPPRDRRTSRTARRGFLLALRIAWDREQHERTAGLRTFTIVAISTCGFLIAARSSFGPSPNADAESRVWQGLLTGIGFIGSGAILKTGSSVRGTATAASIWSTAAGGAAVAYGNYDIAIVLKRRELWRAAVAASFKSPREDTPGDGSTSNS